MAAHSVCNHLLIATRYLLPDNSNQSEPLMLMNEGAGDGITWWVPNRPCLIQWLKAAGFSSFDIERTIRLTVDKPYKDETGRSSAVDQVQRLVHTYL